MIKEFDTKINYPRNDTTLQAASVSLEIPVSKARAFATSQRAAVSKRVKSIYTSVPSTRPYFLAEVQAYSSYDLVMIAQDLFHDLHCKIPLRFQAVNQGEKEHLALISQFPMIGDCALGDTIEEDENLLGFVLICFHVFILENLILFCASQTVETLIINTMEAEYQVLEIYKDFSQSMKKTKTPKGNAVELTIPLYTESLRNCQKFMDIVMDKFCKTLRHNQRANPIIRNYLNQNMHIVTSKEKRS